MRVVFLTGTRADFGKIKSLISALVDDRDRFDVHVFATGMHMEPKYGFTVQEIQKCGFPNIYTYINQASQGVLDRTLANTVLGFGDYVRLIEPDLIVVHGDRSEALAGALVGSINNILVAHVEGGELSGTIDELIRHAVSKMSHLHFVSNEAAATRLLQLGEDPGTIHVIGSPDIDILTSPFLPSLDWVKAHYDIPFDEFGVLAFHPVTTALPTLQEETVALLQAVEDSNIPYVAIYPNSDPGSEIILAEYERAFAKNPRVRVFPSVRFEAMLVLLQEARLVLGNSSMGICEAPYYGTPTVNVGTRQQGRTKNPHILHAAANRHEILRAIRCALELRQIPKSRTERGQGDSHLRFLDVLSEPSLYQTPVQKRFHDLPADAVKSDRPGPPSIRPQRKRSAA